MSGFLTILSLPGSAFLWELNRWFDTKLKARGAAEAAANEPVDPSDTEP